MKTVVLFMHTELKWVDRQIWEAKGEITALLRSHEEYAKLIEDQKEHKKKQEDEESGEDDD